MAENIFRYATGIDVTASRTLYQAVSQSGTFRSIASATPAFYYWNVSGPTCTREIYNLIQRDIINMNYGANTVITTIPHGPNGTAGDGVVWYEGTPLTVSNHAVAGANFGSVGTTLMISAIPGIVIQAGNWIQLQFSDSEVAGSYKVYQVAETVTTTSGLTPIRLNTALTRDPEGNSLLRLGADVQFKLALTEIPAATTVPGGQGRPLYAFDGQFVFREVL